MAKKADNPIIREKCNKCKFCTSWHNKDYKGDFILGKCSVIGLDVLLNHDYCDKFEKK